MHRFHHTRFIRRMMRRGVSFFIKNGQLLLLVGLTLCGVLCGVIAYRSTAETSLSQILSVIFHERVPASFSSGCYDVLCASVFGVLFLTALFVLGMTPFGCPIVLLIDFIFGAVVGVLNGQVYFQYGFLYSMITSVPYLVITGIAVVPASKHAMHISCAISRQFLPNGAHCGSLWHDFKRYLLHFLVCILIVFSASIVDVLLKIAYYSL